MEFLRSLRSNEKADGLQKGQAAFRKTSDKLDENSGENHDENHGENHDENHDKNHDENHDENHENYDENHDKNHTRISVKSRVARKQDQSSDLEEALFWKRPVPLEAPFWKIWMAEERASTQPHPSPHNPFLLKTFNAYLNVEFANSVKSIKCICKYINKGSDQAIYNLSNAQRPDPLDEVSNHEMGRYISSSEAVWRMLGFSIHEHYPPVVQLAVHLENGQRVYFNPDDTNLRERLAAPPKSTSTAFF